MSFRTTRNLNPRATRRSRRWPICSLYVRPAARLWPRQPRTLAAPESSPVRARCTLAGVSWAGPAAADIEEVGYVAHSYCEHSGRTECNVRDVTRALQSVGQDGPVRHPTCPPLDQPVPTATTRPSDTSRMQEGWTGTLRNASPSLSPSLAPSLIASARDSDATRWKSSRVWDGGPLSLSRGRSAAGVRG